MSIKVVPFLIYHCLNTFLDYHIINEGQNIKEAILGATIKHDHICSHINPWKLKFLSSINYMVIIIFPKFCNSSIDILSIRSKKLFWVVKICTAKKKHVHKLVPLFEDLLRLRVDIHKQRFFKVKIAKYSQF